jgi:O-antigen/teichoic acid export membrane protein
MRAAFPVGIASVFSTTLFRVDAALLAFFASAAVVGDYGAAYRLFETTLFLSYSVGTAVYPVFARLGPGSEPPLRVVRDGGLKLAIVATLPLAVAAAVLGPGLVPLVYGEAFDEGGIALVLLAPAIALYPIEHIAAAMLVAQRRQKIVAAVVGVVALQNVIANVLLIPVFSLKAAALNTSISEALLAVSFLYLAGRTAGGFEWARVTAGPVLAACLAGATMLLLRDMLAVAAAAGAVVYFTALVAWERRRFPEDARLVSDLLLRRA